MYSIFPSLFILRVVVAYKVGIGVGDVEGVFEV